MSKVWEIPVEWECFGVVKVEADTLEEAVRIVDLDEDDMPLPQGDYIDGSFKIGKYELDKDALDESNLDYYRQFN